ncbi:RQC domain-containing protein [Malaciobacter molluscorum]|uniref:RQC domain-containing protein n=1 Tax=Malaciobacter molluscorum TaxID=1032072 RepID=UPI001D194F7D|nr:RQC domain-containing protein [Malaciobacter molluscorum]
MQFIEHNSVTNHIIDVIRGSKNQKILEFEHDKLNVYALGKDKSKNEWIAIVDKLIDNELTNLGIQILKGNEKLLIDSDKLGIANQMEEEKTELTFDEELYEKFRELKRKYSY